MTGLVVAQGAGTQAPQGQTPAPATEGRGADPGQRGAGRGGGRQDVGGRRGGFTQFTRELAPQDVIVRGKGLYEANCASCHAADLRGGANGANLLRSGIALSDRHGELVGDAVAKHNPALTLASADTVAIAEYSHSIHATMSGQGSPPGRSPTGLELNVLVGDAKAGEAYFAAACTKCHSTTGDLNGIGAKFSDPRALQNVWVSGSSSAFGGFGGRGAAGAGNPVTVTLADGSKVEGTLVRKDDFLVILMLPDGTRDHVLVGTGNDLDAPGFLKSLDPRTGEVQWILYSTPQNPGDPGLDTWVSLDAARHGNGATWIPGSYDPDTNLYLYGTGNPTPAYTQGRGEGDNLFTSSLLAVNVDTGKIVWYFQTSPHDTHDWDSTQTPILADMPFNGRTRKLVMTATRNGYFFVLDRTTASIS
jgi:mono/diheme cytochrome c family protein